MPCSICQRAGHNRRTCPDREPVALLDARINRIRQYLENDRLRQREDRRDQIRARLLERQRLDVGWEGDARRRQDEIDRARIHQEDPVPEVVGIPVPEEVDDRRDLIIRNLRDDNYYIYWVNGNNLIMSLDDQINDIVCLEDVLVSNQQVTLKVRDGERYYLVPSRLSSGGEQVTDKHIQGIIRSYKDLKKCKILSLDIHEGHQEHVFLDDGETLSEKNQWKFCALKLDYLLREVIKLGGMNYENLNPILDLHQDIRISQHSELDKEYAGVPSEFTNMT